MGKKAKKPPRRPGRANRDREELKAILDRALREEFPRDTVDVSDGYQDNIHILVVSRRFDGMQEAEKQDLLWQIINGTNLTEGEKLLVSLVMPLSPAEIK